MFQRSHIDPVPGNSLSLEQLFAVTPLPMWVYDLETFGFLEVNDAAVARYGFTRDEFLRMRITDIRPPEDVATLMRELAEGRARIQRSGEWRHLTKSGEMMIVEIHSHSVRFQGHEAVLVAVHDITDQRRIEQELRSSEARFRDLFENAYDIITVHSLDERITSANLAAERMTGFTRRELLQMGVDRIFAPEDVPRLRAAIARALTGISPGAQNFTMLDKDGQTFPVELTMRVLYSGGVAVAVESVARDLTERQRAQDALRRQRERADALATFSRALADSSNDVLAICETVTRYSSTLVGDAATVRLLDANTGELSLVASDLAPVTGAAGGSDDDTYDALFARAREAGGPITGGNVMTVPLFHNGDAMGSISLRRGPGAPGFTGEDERFMTELGDRAAVSIANARLFEETGRRLREVQLLRRIDTAINGTHDVRNALSVIVEQIRTELRVDAVSIMLLNERAATFTYATGGGFRTPRARQEIRLGEGYAGRAATERRTFVIPDVRVDRDFKRPEFAAREGFISFIAIPLIARGRVKGVLEMFHRRPISLGDEALGLMDALATQAAIAIDGAQMLEDLQRALGEQTLAYETTLEGWARALDLRDREAEGHSVRVARLTAILATEIGLDDDALVHIRRGALLHDIGKMGIPDVVLQKPGALTPDDWDVMRKHPVYAYELLWPVEFLRPALHVPLFHHERWDGSGYPRGTAGAQIPVEARIFSVIDVWDALRSDRPYRKALPEEEARAYIAENSRVLFDPMVVDTFLRLDI